MRAGWVAMLALAALVGAAHLQAVAGWRVALPSLPLWRNPPGDMAQAVAGAEALLRDPAWHLPLAATDRLITDGRPLSIVYTDSAPWIAIAAKAADLGAGSVSIIGLALCLSFLLQPVAVALLLLAAGVRRVEVIAFGTVLGTLLPAWYQRILDHVALSSHWVLVLALALAVRAIRTRVSPAVVAGLCALGALALGLHAYLFVMVAAVAAGGLLADVARIGRPALPRAFAGLMLFLAASGVSAWLLGYGSGGGVGGFGLYSMNLLSPVMPQVSGLSQILIGDALPVVDATGGQYEGFNYLGAGLLLTLVLAALVRLTGGSRSGIGTRRAALPLAVAVAALAAAAPSNQVFLGHVRLLAFTLPGEAILNDIRATGRLFWPAAYALLVLALSVVDKAPRRMPVAGALGVAVLLQAVDTGPLRRLARATWAGPPLPPTASLDPWRQGPLGDAALRIIPRFICAPLADQPLQREITLVVIRSGGRVEGGPVARTRPDACAEDRLAAISTTGEPGWDRLLLWDALTPAILLLAADRAGDCAPLLSGLACGSGVAAALRAGTLALQPSLLPRLTPLTPGETVNVTLAGAGRPLLGPGWWGPETDGTWTDGYRATLVLPLADGWRGGVTVAVDAFAYPSPSGAAGQAVAVWVGGQVVARWMVSSRERGRFEAEVSERLVHAGRPVVLELALPDAVTPRRADGTREPWRLGIKVRALSVRATITPSDAAAR